MSRKPFGTVGAFVFAVVAIAFVAQPSFAGVILQGASSSSQGSFGGAFAIQNAGNQSGLSAGYISGVTDFDTYVAGTTHASPGSGTDSGFTAIGGLPQQFTFDLGGVFKLDALAFWSTDNIGSVIEFELFSDGDGIFGNGGLTSLGIFFPVADALGAVGSIAASQIFGFAVTTTQFFHLEALDTAGGPTLVPGIGEVAFRVPEPSTLALFAFGLAGLGFVTRRRRTGMGETRQAS